MKLKAISQTHSSWHRHFGLEFQIPCSPRKIQSQHWTSTSYNEFKEFGLLPQSWRSDKMSPLVDMTNQCPKAYWMRLWMNYDLQKISRKNQFWRTDVTSHSRMQYNYHKTSYFYRNICIFYTKMKLHLSYVINS